jgi:septal ring factor EnvC (AmiA/AmiB activator)
MACAGAEATASAIAEPTAASDEVASSAALAALAASAAAPTPGHSVTVPLFESEALETAIARLKAEQKAMKEKKRKIHKDLKNAEKRRSRLKKRARQLSDADLVAVLQMRGSVPSHSGSSSASASTAPPSVVATADEGSEDAP